MKIKTTGLAALLACLAGLPQPALADIIHLSTGGVVKGEIIARDDRTLRVRTAAGETLVYRDDVDLIEPGTVEEVYRRRLGQVASRDADGHFELSRWCEAVREPSLRRDELEKTIIIEPDHVHARLALGYQRVDGEWALPNETLDADEDAALAQATPGNGSARASSARSSARRENPSTRGLPPFVEELLEGLRSGDRAVREASYQGLADVERRATEELLAALTGEERTARRRAAREIERTDRSAAQQAEQGAPGDAELHARLEPIVRRHVAERIAGPVRDLLAAHESRLARDLARGLREARGMIREYDSDAANERRGKVLERWAAAKDEALRVIFDLSIYPDENHGRVGQPTVDLKVAAVREIYEFLDLMIEHDIARILAMSEQQARDALARAVEARERLIECRRCLGGAEAADAAQAPVAEVAPIIEALLRYRAGDQDGALALVSRLSPWEVRLLERLRDHRVLDHNERVLRGTEPIARGQRPAQDEHEQVLITNRYRMMMGRRALELHPALEECARGHSQEMTRLGYFDHQSPVAANGSPSDRARNAGYSGGVGENISLGSESPQATHDAWYNSSGHHRNILGADWRAMGAGKDGQHWTQNFGESGVCRR